MHPGGKKSLARAGASLGTLATTIVAGALSSSAIAQETQPEPGTEARAQRAVQFTVPLRFGNQVFGDVLIEADGASDVAMEAESLRNEFGALLNETGKRMLDEAIFGRAFVRPSDLEAIGLIVRFNQSQLLLVVESIPGELRPVQSLGQTESVRTVDSLPVIEPASFSTYLNANVNVDYARRSGLRDPDLFLNGATRWGDVVVEYDGAFTDQFSEGYRFYRRGVRAVYDQPNSYRRYSAGDLRVNTVPLLQTPFIGGVSLEKRRRLFDPYLPVARLGGREIFLDNDSTVDVLINGERYQTFQLEPGRYDLANLPVQLGNNDVQLRIRDSAGRQQLVALNFFYEPLDLPAGESEYVLATGFVADNLGFEPDYTDRAAFMGMYRRAVSDTLILGGGLQVSEDVQAASIASSFVPQFVPGAFDVEFAASRGDRGTGFAARGAYRFRTSGSFARASQLSVNVDFESKNYQTLADVIPVDFDLLNVGANFTQGLGEDTYLSAGAIYSRISGDRPDRSTFYADIVHRLTERLRATAGVEYGTGSIFGRSFGIRVGIAMSFGGSTRANIDYRSRTETLRASLSQGSDDSVGSLGYDLGFVDSRGQTSVDANVDYIGNRLDARLSLFSNGSSLGSITDDQRARLQVGTSIAYADGAFGVGRPIGDAFALVHPHPALRDTEIVSGRSLSENRFDAASGVLGAAVQSDLASYSQQSVQYDVEGMVPGADIGDGIARLEPPFRGGYSIQVGSAYYVSVSGVLYIDGEPAKLAVGTVSAEGDDEFAPMTFFTNSNGRFALLGLAPGGTYLVDLRDVDRDLVINVPNDDQALFQLGRVDLASSEE